MTIDPPALRAANDLLDVDCISRIGRGEPAALRELYDRHAGKVFAFSRRMLGDAHEAEEVTQDVFVRAWRKARDYDPRRASVWAWLVIMTRSCCLDRLRRRRRRPDLAANFAAAEPESVDHVVTDRHDTDVATEAAGTDIGSLLGLLRPMERACVAHVFFDGLTQAETASRTGLPLGTVKTHLRRGMLRLRQFLSRHDS